MGEVSDKVFPTDVVFTHN